MAYFTDLEIEEIRLKLIEKAVSDPELDETLLLLLGDQVVVIRGDKNYRLDADLVFLGIKKGMPNPETIPVGTIMLYIGIDNKLFIPGYFYKIEASLGAKYFLLVDLKVFKNAYINTVYKKDTLLENVLTRININKPAAQKVNTITFIVSNDGSYDVTALDEPGSPIYNFATINDNMFKLEIKGNTKLGDSFTFKAGPQGWVNIKVQP